MEINFFKDLAAHFNLTWRAVKLERGEVWGNELQNGTMVGGVIETLRNGTADVAISNLWQRHNYIADVEFGPPMNMVRTSVLVFLYVGVLS